MRRSPSDITDLKVVQIRVFPVDVVPVGTIATKSCVEKLTESLSTSEVQTLPLLEGKNIVAFRRGELKTGKRIIIINRMDIEPRRVVIEVEGTSQDANTVFKAFLTTVASVLSIDLEALRRPLLLAEATQCVATLGFSFSSLFHDAFVEFLQGKVQPKATSNMARASVRPSAITTEIVYEIADKILAENKITMNPKQFTIAPRPGAPIESRRYLISSPLGSDAHIQLIDELDKVITNSSSTAIQQRSRITKQRNTATK